MNSKKTLYAFMRTDEYDGTNDTSVVLFKNLADAKKALENDIERHLAENECDRSEMDEDLGEEGAYGHLNVVHKFWTDTNDWNIIWQIRKVNNPL